MINETPYWYKLIFYWVTIKKRNGLTIPFIIGAKKLAFPNKTNETNNISNLLTEIVNSSLDNTITLLFCPDIGDYVLGLSNPDRPMSGIEIKNPLTNKVSLIATLSTQLLGTNITDISNSLKKKYADCLREKKFSLNNLKWTTFTDDDTKMINEALKYNSTN